MNISLYHSLVITCAQMTTKMCLGIESRVLYHGYMYAHTVVSMGFRAAHHKIGSLQLPRLSYFDVNTNQT